VQDAVDSPADHPDLTDCELVFFGDSVMGNYHDFASIPGVVHALTGATVHNLAIGGSSATRNSDDDNSFPNVVQDFLDHNTEELSGDKKLCFLINYGLNDYFGGFSIDDYQNGLRTGIRALRESYPDARIIVISSNYILSFEKGMARTGDEENVLEDYIAAAEETAAAENVDFLNINDALQWNENNAAKYLVDSIHPNEEGRFLFGVEVTRAWR
jgi:lysophospholipase L1-like esterase